MSPFAECHRKISNAHATLTSDKYAALLYSEEAIFLAKETPGRHNSFRLGLMMFQCGKLNIGYNARQRGLAQMSEGMGIVTRLYGCDNTHVQLATEDLRKIRRVVMNYYDCTLFCHLIFT